MWDDHDFGGNASDARNDVHEAARLTYQEYVPHYPLAAGSGNVPIHHAFTVGRVRFILTDLRSARTPITVPDDASKTMLGSVQKEWLKSELLAAKSKYPLIFWVSTVPWLGINTTNYYPVPAGYTGFAHHRNLPPLPISQGAVYTRGASRAPPEDHWSLFSTERRELADFIKENGIKGLCILHGDAHMLAADNGSNADYATVAARRFRFWPPRHSTRPRRSKAVPTARASTNLHSVKVASVSSEFSTTATGFA
jgi:alkaline phosphatase D